MEFTFETWGSTKNTEAFLEGLLKKSPNFMAILNRYGRAGVSALEAATPIDSMQTARSWRYEIEQGPRSFSLVFYNDHVVDGVPVAVLIQYGHGTGTGGYVPARDYINPALRPIFDRLADEVWKAVTSA